MYNFLEYSSNYSGIIDSLWFYSKEEANNFKNDDANNNNCFKFFDYETKLLERTEA